MNHIIEASESARIIQFRGPQVTAGFTSRDLIELGRWDAAGRRMEIDDESDSLGQFAMIYDGGEPWASWAISREGCCVLAWDCISLTDIGRFATIADALAALPGNPAAARPVPVARASAEVVPLRRAG